MSFTCLSVCSPGAADGCAEDTDPLCRAVRHSAETAVGRLVKLRAFLRASASWLAWLASLAGRRSPLETTALPVLRYTGLSTARDCEVRAVSREVSNAAPACRKPHRSYQQF